MTQSLNPGENFPFSAQFWNPFLQAADDYRTSRTPRPNGPGGLLHGQHAIEVLVRNESSATVVRHGVLRVSGVAITPTDREASFRDRPILIGMAPDGPSSHGIVVTLEAIKQNEIGRAMIVGLAVAKVNVTAADHKFAKPINANTTNFASDPVEGFPIIWGVHTGSQPSWCAILLGSGPAATTTIVIARALEDVIETTSSFDCKIKATISGTPQTFNSEITVENLRAGNYLTPDDDSAYGHGSGNGEVVAILKRGMNLIAVKARADFSLATGWMWLQTGGVFLPIEPPTEEAPPP